uniref:ADP-ribosylation factor-like protein 10 n=1 Tax=Gouania willdenowi TaxID=441366 RepID=A0A8C5EI10_GOUWI
MLVKKKNKDKNYAKVNKKQNEQDQGGKAQLQVLVVGLDGAGKSSVLQALSCEGRSRRRKGRSFRPTRGFNFLSVHMPTCQLDFLEIGGAEDLRCHWSDYLRRSDLLLFVVDSSDKRRLPLAKAELHRLLRARPRLPTVVLGNKQVNTSWTWTGSRSS